LRSDNEASGAEGRGNDNGFLTQTTDSTSIITEHTIAGRG